MVKQLIDNVKIRMALESMRIQIQSSLTVIEFEIKLLEEHINKITELLDAKENGKN